MSSFFTDGLAQVTGEKNDSAGRFVTATCNINQGVQVLHEEAYVQGPRQNSQDIVCIECCKILNSNSMVRCDSCEFPLCQQCSQLGSLKWHNKECQIFVRNGIKFGSLDDGKKLYPCITVLRLGLSGLADLETHSQERKDTPVWFYNKKSVYPFLLRLRSDDGEQLFSEDYLDNITGTLDTNSFKIQEEGIESRAVFITASMFNNSCVPNCQREVTRDGIIIKTSRPVKQDEELTICYTGLLTPNHIRQAIFKQTKYFTCGCARCQDPTELNTFPDSIRCQQCKGPVLNYRCHECGEEIDPIREKQVRTLCDTLVNRLVGGEDCEMLKNGFMKLEKMLWKYNYLLVKLYIHIQDHKGICEVCQQSSEFNLIEQNLKDLKLSLGISTKLLNNEKVRDHQEAATKMSKMML